MSVAKLALSVILTSLVSVGCGSDSDTGTPSVTDTGTAPSDSAPQDSTASDSASPTDTGSMTTPTDLTFDADFIGKGGPHVITGTVTLPAGAAAGRPIQFEVIRKGGGNQVGPAGTTSASGTMTYKITGLEAADYQIGVRVDQTNNGKVNDPGDYIGFARGTVAAPKLTSAMADTITVAGAVSGVDFGLGVQP